MVRFRTIMSSSWPLHPRVPVRQAIDVPLQLFDRADFVRVALAVYRVFTVKVSGLDSRVRNEICLCGYEVFYNFEPTLGQVV